MNHATMLATLALALAGCETTAPSGGATSMKSLSEFSTHMDCLALQASQYAKVEGSPLELGIIGASACNASRARLRTAITNREGAAFARGYMNAAEREEPKMIAAEIIRLRG